MYQKRSETMSDNKEQLEQDNPSADETLVEPIEMDQSADLQSESNEFAQLQAQHEELKDKHIRLIAEFDNYKKRTLKEKIDMMKSASQDMMAAMLSVLDDFDRAQKNNELSEGIQLIHAKFNNILKQKGLEVMDTDGKNFDPEWHEALTEIPAPTDELKGKVIDTIEKGYLLGEKIIRHAKVVIGK